MKPIKNVKVGDVIFFEGIDLSSTDDRNWLALEECAKETPSKIEGIGFVVATNHETISLATLRATDKETAFGILAVVPRGIIKRVCIIHRGKRKR